MKRKLKFKNKLGVPFIYKPYNAKEMAKTNKQTKKKTKGHSYVKTLKKVSNYRQIAHQVTGFRLIDLESRASKSRHFCAQGHFLGPVFIFFQTKF